MGDTSFNRSCTSIVRRGPAESKEPEICDALRVRHSHLSTHSHLATADVREEEPYQRLPTPSKPLVPSPVSAQCCFVPARIPPDRTSHWLHPERSTMLASILASLLLQQRRHYLLGCNSGCLQEVWKSCSHALGVMAMFSSGKSTETYKYLFKLNIPSLLRPW